MPERAELVHAGCHDAAMSRAGAPALDLLPQLGRSGEDVDRQLRRARTRRAASRQRERARDRRRGTRRAARRRSRPAGTSRDRARGSGSRRSWSARACETSARRRPAGSARPAARARFIASAKRSASTQGAPTQLERPAWCRGPPTRWCPRTAPSPDRRWRCRASGCSATAAPTACPVVVEIHRPAPALHRDDLEVGADAERVVEEARELADGHAVPHRNRIQADERLEPVHQHRPFDARRRQSGFGRSQTMTVTPCAARPRRQFAIV